MGRSGEVTFATLLFACLAGCASGPQVGREPRPTDARVEDRMVMMRHQIREQEAEIERLNAALEALRSRVADKSAAPPAKSPGAKGHDSLDDEGISESLPMKKLSPPEGGGGNEEDEEPEIDTADHERPKAPAARGKQPQSVPRASSEVLSGESVADSTHETMHLYYRGLQQIQEGLYDDAQQSLRDFLKLSPGHVYADRAQYLIADAHFRSREYGLVVIATNVLESSYPHSFRLPEALFKRAVALESLGQADQARLTLRELLKRFPKDPTADGASRKLAELSLSLEKAQSKPVPLIEEVN